MSDIIWEQFSHQYMWDTVQSGPGVGAAQNTVDSWARAQQRLTEIDGMLSTALDSITGRWEGVAADATRTGLTPLGVWVTESAARARAGATSLVDQADQVAWVRNNLPPPPREPTALDDQIFGPIPTPSATEPWYAGQQRAAEAQRVEAREQALHVMNTYSANSEAAQLPLTPPPPPPVVTVAGAGGAAVGSGTAAGGVRARSAAGLGSVRSTTPAAGGASVGDGGGVPLGGAPGLDPTAIAAAGGTGGPQPSAGGGIAGTGRAVAGGGLTGGDGTGAGAGEGGLAAGLPGSTAGRANAAVGTAGGTVHGARPTGPSAGPTPAPGTGRGELGTGGGPVSRGTAALPGGTPGHGGASGSGGVPGYRGGAGGRPGTGNGGTGYGTSGGGTSGFGGSTRRGPATSYGTPGYALGERAGTVPPRTAEPLSWRNDPNITGRGLDGPGRAPDVTEHAPTRSPLTGGVEEPHTTGSRGASGGAGTGMMPMGAGTGGQQSQGRRRPGYLIDDSGAFVDDRWFTEPVITPDDPLPPQPRR